MRLRVWTGGFIQFVNAYELKHFAQLAERYGPRFTPPELLLRKAETGETFA